MLGREPTFCKGGAYFILRKRRKLIPDFLDTGRSILPISLLLKISHRNILSLERGQKIALTGANGIGKTTLIRSILGLVKPLKGICELGQNISVGYFEQEGDGKNTSTCIEEIWNEFPSFTQYEVRSALAKCGLTTKHIESQVRVLSGGEQAKVRLCKLINKETNVLMLDEPTNHLDTDAKEALKQALNEYRGTVLLICHEPEFYRDIVHEVWDCSKWTTRTV